MERFTQRWQRTPTPIRKPLVAITGLLIIVAGIAMLVLPGPGWLTIFVGLAVLATEFALAKRLKDAAERRAKSVAATAAKRLRKK
jgi:uncharacterized protein (TIGR02611 family)